MFQKLFSLNLKQTPTADGKQNTLEDTVVEYSNLNIERQCTGGLCTINILSNLYHNLTVTFCRNRENNPNMSKHWRNHRLQKF